MSTTHREVTISIEEDIKVNLWCHLCEYMLKTPRDIEIHDSHGCCHECWLTFGEE
jgi:predicted aldo/keto reductase-like oxidoreductase